MTWHSAYAPIRIPCFASGIASMAKQAHNTNRGEPESGEPAMLIRTASFPVGAIITLRDLRARRDAILDLAARRGATNVRVFGSVARGGAGPDSDVDLLVEFASDRSLLDQVALIQDLTELLGHRVDVVSDRGLNPRLRQRVLDQAVPL